MENTTEQAPEAEVSGLPSEQTTPEQVSGFEVNPDELTDGKYDGRWSNPKEMSEYIKNMEDKHANLTREVADASKQTDKEISEAAKESQSQSAKESTIANLAPKFLENGMVVDDEMKQQLMDVGISEMEIKVGAYELKEALDLNAGYVGGKENYDIIMNHHATTMTDEEKMQFNHSIQNPNNSKALMLGLQVMYEQSVGEKPNDDAPVTRVKGNPAAQTGVKPYENKSELLRDKKYADSRVSSASDKAKFRQRLNVTPESVWLS